MQACRLILLTAVMAASAVVYAEEGAVDGTALAIRTVVSGKTCVGDDVLTFGKSTPGSAGTFERVGHPADTYSIGYGTILIRRDQNVHGHVASVSPSDRMLYLSTGAYRCGM